jgi:hypothetical protein
MPLRGMFVNRDLCAVGIKEMTPLNMVRMGLAKAKSFAMIGRASWKGNWEMHSDNEVKPMYDRVMDHLLNQKPYGEFHAVEEIFGREMALQLATKQEVIQPQHCRGLALAANQEQKRKFAETGNDEREHERERRQRMESDDEVEIIDN